MSKKTKKTKEVGEIVLKYRDRLGDGSGRAIARAEFGALLVEGFSTMEISRQTIYNWERGNNDPHMDFLVALYTYHFGKDTWQLRFATECLKAIYPEIFKSGPFEINLPGGNHHT